MKQITFADAEYAGSASKPQEKHEVAAGILAVINGYLGDCGLSLRQGTIVDATLIMR